ncbi:MAG TPA: glycosyltransferase family 39 protein [Pyrinomonadaceae bacterium]|nr:glycosyltransferase family 39 protein [Pyrinomonadaceae bacterium]
MDPFIGDWDGLDYTMLSVAGYPSSMALGRNLFIFGNYGLYRIANALFHLPPESAYLLFKYSVVAQSPLALIACWILARDVTGSLHSATLTAVIVGLSPVFVVYGGQVMTDVPAVLLLAVALIVHLRGIKRGQDWLVVMGAAILGLGMNLRETVGFYAPWLLLAPWLLRVNPGRRELKVAALSCAVFLLFAFGWFGYWYVTDAHYRFIWHGWRESMNQESSRHPVSLQNLRPYLTYFFITAPLVFISLPFALRKGIKSRSISPALLLGVVGLFANILLFFNYSTAVNWRYFLTGLPALAPLTSDYMIQKLSRRTSSTTLAFVACLGVIVVGAILFSIYIRPVSQEFIERRALSKEYRNQLVHVPRDAVMISGSQTIAVTYWKAMGLGEWKTIGTGGGWPGDSLVPEIQNHIAAGRRVFLDTDPRWWVPCSWQRHEIPAIVALENEFGFRRVSETIYELKPAGDTSALDKPNLKRLLPENRPEDLKKCPRNSV